MDATKTKPFKIDKKSLASGGLKNREPYVTVARRFSG
jgi:hypothetical protein